MIHFSTNLHGKMLLLENLGRFLKFLYPGSGKCWFSLRIENRETEEVYMFTG